jgi:hypothetical protein
VRTLKEIGLRFEFGFMLLDPSSTFETVRGNIGFLRKIVGDGCAPATFCKMLPYDGTPIKDDLEAAGRLKGDVCAPDYDFLDPRLNAFYETLARIVDITGWVHGPRALTMQLEWAHTEVPPRLSSLSRARLQLGYRQLWAHRRVGRFSEPRGVAAAGAGPDRRADKSRRHRGSRLQ